MLTNLPQVSFRIQLGGIIVDFHGSLASQSLVIASSFLPFIAKIKPDFTLCVAPPTETPPFPQTVLFKAENWMYGTYEDHKIIRQQVLENGVTERIVTVLLAAEGNSGTVYLPNGKSDGKQVVPPLSIDILLAAHLLAQERGILAHGCGVRLASGDGYLFVGISGAGKSTLARLWQAEPGVTVLSDERVAIRRARKGFRLIGTPWCSAAMASSPLEAKLKAVFVLKHASQNEIRRLRPIEAAALLVGRSFLPHWEKSGMDFSLQFLAELAECLPCFELGFVPDASALQFVQSQNLI